MADLEFDRIYQQIEATADFYEPSVYSILGGSDAFILEDDPLGEDFVPVSPAAFRGGQEVKKFVVGILPPTSEVTGRLLDRTNSVAAIAGAGYQEVIEGSERNQGKQVDPENFKWTDLSDDFWLRWVEMCDRLGVDPEAMAAIFYNESQFNPYIGAKGGTDHIVARGLGQLIKSVAHIACVSEEDWYHFNELSAEDQLPHWEEFLRKARVRGKGKQDLYVGHFGYIRGNPEGILYASKQYMADNPDDFKDLTPGQRALNARAYEQNCAADGMHMKLVTEAKVGGVVCGKDSYQKGYIGLEDLGAAVSNLPPPGVVAKINEARRRSDEGALSGAGSDPTASLNCGDKGQEDGPSNWEDGSAEAAYIRNLQNSLADTGILSGKEVAQMFTAAQTQMIKKTRAELTRMKNTPPLRMLVAPQKFTVSGEKIVADGNFGRYGPIVEHWGDSQGKIEASGKIAGFYAVDKYGGPQGNTYAAMTGSNDVTGKGGPGLSRTIRNFSQSYQNFMSLWLLYRNNGGLWLEFESYSTGQKYQNLSAVGSIWIYYDNILYFGSFDSFSISESDTAPFTLEYNFSFTVRASFVLDRIADPGMNYTSKSLVGADPRNIPGSPFVTSYASDDQALNSMLDNQRIPRARGMLEVDTGSSTTSQASASGRRRAIPTRSGS